MYICAVDHCSGKYHGYSQRHGWLSDAAGMIWVQAFRKRHEPRVGNRTVGLGGEAVTSEELPERIWGPDGSVQSPL